MQTMTSAGALRAGIPFPIYAGPSGGGGGSDVNAAIEAVNRAFEEFKAEHTKQLAEVKKGFADVVTAEKVDRINASVTELQNALDEQAKKLGRLTAGGGGRDEDAARAEHRRGFEAWFRRGAEANLRELEVNAKLTTQSDPDGGYTVPTEMETTIDRVLTDVSSMRAVSTVRTIGAQSFRKLVNQGGATAGWAEENDARPETGTSKLSGLEFPAKELYSQPAATQTMLDDSVLDIGAWLADEVSIAFAEQEGDAFVNGNGVGQPRGLLSYDTVANASYAWGKLGYLKTGAAGDFLALDTATGKFPGDCLIDLVHALRRGYRVNARWLMNDLTVGRVRKLKDADGNYLWRPGLEATAPSTLLGYPVESDDFMPDVANNSLSIAFGDFKRGYLIVDRAGIRVLRDPFTSKPNVLFYTTKRVGGGVQNFEAIKLLKFST